MATENYDPNARYDNGPNAAGSNGVPPSRATDAFVDVGLSSGTNASSGTQVPGLGKDNALSNGNMRVGFSAAGNRRINVGPNVAGAPRSINGT